MIYVGLDLSDDIKTFYENHNSSIGMPLFNTKESFNLLIYHKEIKNFTTELIENNKLSKFNSLYSIYNLNGKVSYTYQWVIIIISQNL